MDNELKGLVPEEEESSDKSEARPTGDFCFLDSSPEYKLSKFERLTLTGGAELERAISWLASKFGRLPHGDPTGDFSRRLFLEAYEFYTQPRFREDPASFFIAPPCGKTVSERIVHTLPKGEIVDLEFRSEYSVQLPGIQKRYDNVEENSRVHARMWRHREPAKTTVVAIHGWTMGDQRLNSLAFLPGMFYRGGVDVALIELPFHGRRRPERSTDGEILFPSANIARTNEALGQIISDLRQLYAYLRTDSGKQIGVVGMSLGAYIAALWCSLDELEFCIPLVPLVAMEEVAWEVLQRFESFSTFERAGVTREKLGEIYALHCPLNHTLKLPPQKALIIAGLGDPIVPPGQPKMLWQHWGMPTMYWMRGGHVAQLQNSNGYRAIMSFLERLGYLV